jgi:hypothetical protein
LPEVAEFIVANDCWPMLDPTGRGNAGTRQGPSGGGPRSSVHMHDLHFSHSWNTKLTHCTSTPKEVPFSAVPASSA